MISLIDRYVSKVFLLYFFSGLLVFTVIFLAVDFMAFAVQHGQSSNFALLNYYKYYTPTVIYQMIPVACLLATVFSLTNLNKSNELVALFSMGLSLARISAPILLLVSVFSVTLIWLSDRVLPGFEQKKNYIENVEIKGRPGMYSTVTTNKIWYRSKNILFNIKTLNASKALAEGVTLYYFNSKWHLNQLIQAKKVHLDDTRWTLRDGQVTLFADESSFPLTQTFDHKEIEMDESVAELQSSAKTASIMSLSDLKRFIERNKEAGLDTTHYEVDYHAKFGFAFAAFVMSLMGIPFSVSRQRSGSMFLGLGLCIGLAFLYWTLYSSSITLGKHGVIPPWISAWVANAVVMAVSLGLLIRLKR